MDKKWRLILIHLTLLFFVSCSVKWLLVKCSKWLWSLFSVSLMWSSKTWCLSWLCLLPAAVWSSKQAVVDVAVTVSLAAEMSVNLFFQSFVLNVSSSDSLLISVAGMAVYTGYVFMPQHIMAILHYFEVVQWQEGRAHQPTGPVCLWLPVRPPVHLPACRPVCLLGLRSRLFPTRQDFFFPPPFPKLAHIKGQNSEGRAGGLLDDVALWDCFPFTRIFGIVNMLYATP